jgi:hypothetical protein
MTITTATWPPSAHHRRAGRRRPASHTMHRAVGRLNPSRREAQRHG